MRFALLLVASCFALSAWGQTVEFTLDSGVGVRLVEAAPGSKGVCAKADVECDYLVRSLIGKGQPPRTYLALAEVKFEGRTFRLDTRGMVNPLVSAPRTANALVKERRFGGFCYDKTTCFFRAVFGDAGGSFVAEWIVVDGRPVRTMFSSNGDLVAFFLKNIEPPRYQ